MGIYCAHVFCCRWLHDWLA